MRKNKKVTANEAARLLLENDNILILIHAKPDGDAVGSGFALLGMLTRLGKNTRLLCSDELNVKYSLVADENFAERAFFGKDIDDGFVPSYVVSTDLAAAEIMGKITEKYAGSIDLCIDHHAVNTLEADCKLVVTSASAAGEVVLDIAREIEKISGKSVIDKPLADALFCAIISDSGSFRYSNTTEKTFEAAAFLKRCGADTTAISEDLFESRSPENYRFCGRVIANTRLFCGGLAAVSFVTHSEIDELGINDNDVDGAIGLVRELAGISAAVFVRETKDGKAKVSLRSKSNLDVAEICAKFGGGGHVKAAGCLIDANAEDAIKTVVEAVSAAISRGEQ